MLLKLEMDDVTIAQIGYKVSKMKESYTEAAKWHKNTGAGVESGTIKGKDIAAYTVET